MLGVFVVSVLGGACMLISPRLAMTDVALYRGADRQENERGPR